MPRSRKGKNYAKVKKEKDLHQPTSATPVWRCSPQRRLLDERFQTANEGESCGIADRGLWIVEAAGSSGGWELQSQSVLGTFCSKFCAAKETAASFLASSVFYFSKSKR
jgi:hypothetical protein